jgi:hypothetical protein
MVMGESKRPKQNITSTIAADPGCFIPDPDPNTFPSRIPYPYPAKEVFSPRSRNWILNEREV